MTSAAGIVAPASAPAVMKPLKAPKCGAAEEGQDIREEEQGGGWLRHLEGVEEEACRAYHEFEVDKDGEGIVGAPKGRGGNYTKEEDVVLRKTWLDVSRDPSVGGDQSKDAYLLRMKEHFDLRNLNIAQNLFKGEEKRTKKGKIKKGRPFTLPHCYEVLKDDEKWKKREDIDDFDLSKKRKRTIDLKDDDEEDASSEEGKRSPHTKLGFILEAQMTGWHQERHKRKEEEEKR
ncbi:putative receptor protein kinase ZmPK1 [Hordeum vulgare]|nr:putative receptor protein kinase ZmPK1 [Hordeum vulgare]